jgi:translocation and assembly module TamB
MSLWIKKTLKWLGMACVLLLVVMAAVFAVFQTTFVKGLVIRWIGEAVSGPGGGVTLGVVQGVFPFDVRIDHVVLVDKEKGWLLVDGFVFRISAAQLLRGRLLVREIQAREVRLERLPQTEEVEKRGGEPVSWHIPAMPGIRVEQVQLNKFFVGAPILGRAMTFSFGGRLDSNVTDRSIHGAFKAKRLDGPVAQADLSWTVSGDPAVLSVDLAASEEAGGLVASALDLADEGPVRLSLKGTSPLADWTGDLKANVANFGTLDSRVGWVLDHGFSVRADGVIRPHETYLARPPWDLLGKEARFGAEVELGPGDVLVVRRAAVTGNNAMFDFSGRIEDGTGALSGGFHFALTRLDVLGGLGTALAGSLTGEGKVTGTFDRPKIDLDLAAARGVRAGDLSADEMGLHLEGQVKGGDPNESKTWDLKGTGRFQGLRVASEPKLPDGGPVTLSFDAAGLPSGMIELKGFQLANQDMKVGLIGELDLRPGRSPSFKGKMEADLLDLTRYSAFLGTRLGGKTGFSAQVAVNGTGPLVSAAIKGRVQDFTSALPIVRVLAEKTVRFGGVLTIAEEGSRIAVTGLEIDSERMKIQGEGSADLKGGQTDARFQVAIPDLAFLSEPAGTRLNGSLTGGIQIHGLLSAPALGASMTMEPVGVSGFEFEKVEANVQTDPFGPDWSGNLTMDAVQGGRTLKLRSRYSVNQQRLLFTGLSLNGPGVEAAGKVGFDFEKSVLEGDMSGTIEAANWLSDVLRQRIDAKAHLEVSATGGARGQELQFKVSAPEVRMAYGKAKGLEGSGRLHDLFGHVTGEAKIKLETLERETIHVKGLALRAEGDLSTVRFEGSAGGELGPEPFELKAGGKLALSVGGPILEMSLFEGGFAGHEVALKGPTRLTVVEQGFILEKTEIGLDKSSLSAEGRAGPEGVALDSRFEGIPLEAFRVSGFPQVAGTASGRVRITGRIQAPVAEADLEIKGLRPIKRAFEDLPDAAIRASAQVKDRMFSSRVVMEGVSEKPILASLKAPVSFTFSPFVFAFQEGGAMEGRLDAEVRLETLASYFPIENQRAKGGLKATLSLSGSLDSPRLSGTLGLEGGAYDHLGLGLLLRDVAFQLVMTNDKVEIATFRATDGGKGRLDVKGQATLGGDPPIHLELTGQLEGFKALRQDAMTVTVAGPLAVKGSTGSIDVSGDLILEPVEIRIPDQFPPEVVPLDVIEVHGGKPEEAVQEPKPEPSSAFPVALDVKLKMPERLFLRGRGLDSEWEGKLRIKGSAQRPAVTGNLAVVRGTANVLGQVFNLASGSVVFDGTFPPSPQLDMVAEKKSADITARIHVTGSPSALNLKLESDPPLPSDEILSRVLFGKSTTQISPFQALSLAQSISELSGQMSLGIFSRTRRMLGLDQLGVTQSDTAQGGSAVSVGKYLGDNVYLQAEKTVTGQGGKVGVAVDVTRNIKLDTEAGTDAAQVGVIWQWDY